MFTYIKNIITKLNIVIKIFNSITIDKDCIILDNPVDFDIFISIKDENLDIFLNTKRRIFINCDADFREQLRKEEESIEEYLEEYLKENLEEDLVEVR